MKKLIFSLLFGVGILAMAKQSEARFPTDDYAGIAYVTSSSSAAFVSTACPLELISLTATNGDDVKTIVILDTAPWIGISGVNTPGVSTTTLVGWAANGVPYPQSQWASVPMVFHTATGSITGMNVYNLRGTIIKNGLAVFKDKESRSEYWTLQYREIR